MECSMTLVKNTELNDGELRAMRQRANDCIRAEVMNLLGTKYNQFVEQERFAFTCDTQFLVKGTAEYHCHGTSGPVAEPAATPSATQEAKLHLHLKWSQPAVHQKQCPADPQVKTLEAMPVHASSSDCSLARNVNTRRIIWRQFSPYE